MRNSTRHITILAFVAFVFSAHPGFGQQVITNTQGERVVIYPDGSWRQYEESDSVLLNTRLTKNEPILMDPTEGAMAKSNSGSPDDLSDVIMLSRQFAEQTAREARDANLLLSSTMDDKFQLEAELRQVKENKNLIDTDKSVRLEEEYKQKEDQVSKIKKHQKTTTKFAEKAAEIVKMPAEKQSRKLAKLMVEHDTYFNSLEELDLQPENIATRNEEVRYPSTYTGLESAGSALTANGGSGEMVVEHVKDGYVRYKKPCNLVTQKITKDKDGIQLVMESQQVFTHTDPDLRTYFRDKELITCTAYLSQIGENLYLTVNFSIASPNARKNFVGLGGGSLLRLLLLDGTIIDLNNLQADAGKIDPYTGNTVFIGRFLLDKQAQRDAVKSELDKMRVVWRTGYEDYQIYNVDFLINQLDCINSFQ